MIIMVNGRLKVGEDNLVFIPEPEFCKSFLFIKTDFTPTLEQSQWEAYIG